MFWVNVTEWETAAQFSPFTTVHKRPALTSHLSSVRKNFTGNNFDFVCKRDYFYHKVESENLHNLLLNGYRVGGLLEFIPTVTS